MNSGSVFDNNISVDASGNAIISGNLTVNGTTTTVSTTNSVIADKIIELGNGVTGTPSGDAGIIIERGSSTNASLIWDESADTWVVSTTSATGASTGDLTLTDAALQASDLTLSGGDLGFGNGQNATVSVAATAHNAAGKNVTLTAGPTTAGTTNNIAGGSVTIQGGQGKGSGAGGDIIFQTANASGSGSSLNALATALTISDDKSATFEDNVVVKGDIALDDGGSLTEAGGTTAFTFDGSGNVTKIGQDSMSSGDVLTWDGAKFVGEAPTVGDITGVTAGVGLSGGGSSGAVTLTLDLSELSAVTPTVTDSFATLDSDGAVEQRTTITALSTLQAGTAASTGLSASSGVLSVSDLHPVGVSGSANQLITDDGDGTVTSEGNLSFDGSTLAVTGALTTTTTATVGTDLTVSGGDAILGTAGNTTATTISTVTNTGTTVGKALTIAAGSTTTGSNNLNGGDLVLASGSGDGTGTSSIQFKTKVSGTDVAAERMRVHTNGYVGIGTADPATSLHVAGGPAYMVLQNTINQHGAGEAESRIVFADHAQNFLAQVEASHVGTGDDDKGQLIFSTNNDSGLATALTIDEAQLAAFAGSVTVAVDLAVDGVANLDNTDIDGTFQMDGATFDVNASGLVTVDGAGVSIDSAGVAANFTVASDGAGEDLTIAVTGATDSSVVISSTGTGTDAINIDTTAGSIDIDSADNITIDAVDEIVVTTTSADGHISLVSAHTAGVAVHIDADANAGSIVDIDAGILDIDVTGAATIDAASLTVTTDTATFTSANSTDPVVQIKNTTNDANGARLQFVKDKGAAGAANDIAGIIEFIADDANEDQVLFGAIATSVKVHTNGQEGGKITLDVASHDGELQSGIIIQDGDAEDEIDVTLGSGTQSVTHTSGKFGVYDSAPTTAINVINDYQAVTFENQLSAGAGGGRVLRYSPGADDTLTVGGLYFLHTDGTWDATDADAVATGATQMLGIGLGNARSAGCLMEGFIRIPSTEILNTPGSGAVDGLPVYVSTTAAHLDFTAPSGSGDFVRIVGHAIDDDSNDVLIYFNPSNNHVEL